MDRWCRAAAFYLLVISSPTGPLSAAVSCGSTTSENLLGCVEELIDQARSSGQVSLNEQLRRQLENLSGSEGYSGNRSKLKSWSMELKELDPVSNRDTIAALDNAIASHRDEIRAAVSTRAAALQAIEKKSDKNNIHPLFVQRKLDFLLDQEKANFYDRGPFEAVHRALLANSLEEAYFLSGGADKSKLEKEIAIQNELLMLYENPPPYLIVQQRRLQKNSILFWRASILFVLGDKIHFAETLRNLASDNKSFGLDLETLDPGHIYSYRIFNLPYDLRVVARSTRDAPGVESKDPNVINRFYNPSQLALVTCAQLNVAGTDEGIQSFMTAVKDLAYYDYYVVAGSSDKDENLRMFDAAFQKAINSGKYKEQLDGLMQSILAEGNEFYEVVASGARLCGINDADRDEIYSSFKFTTRIERHREPSGRYTARLLLGGRLNANQASAVADFVKRTFESQEVRGVVDRLGINTSTFTVRVQIDK